MSQCFIYHKEYGLLTIENIPIIQSEGSRWI
jgi:hypothetical protein